MSPIVILFFFIDHSPTLAAWVITLTLLTDKLDGSLARLWNVESDFGKKIESIADPIFVSVALLYTTLYFNIPLILIICAGIAAIVLACARILVQMKTQQLFYEKSQITRFLTFFASILIIAYVFSVPYRELLIWPAIVYGVFATMNYSRILWRFYKKNT